MDPVVRTHPEVDEIKSWRYSFVAFGLMPRFLSLR